LKQAPPGADILAAAATAAYFSRARTSAKVPVIYTQARYVRKPRKAPPGKVIVERERSIMVEPALPPPWGEDE
jgi:predicted ribosome quality control (RQC) complex YloA/Tae2 family protein